MPIMNGASMLKTAFEQSLHVFDQCIPVDGVDGVEPVDRIGCPVLPVIVIGGDHHCGDFGLSQQRLQFLAEVGLARRGRAGDADQQGRFVHQPPQAFTTASSRCSRSPLVHSEPMARMT